MVWVTCVYGEDSDWSVAFNNPGKEVNTTERTYINIYVPFLDGIYLIF